MQTKPTWGCEVSEFNWHYDSERSAFGDVVPFMFGAFLSFSAAVILLLFMKKSVASPR